MIKKIDSWKLAGSDIHSCIADAIKKATESEQIEFNFNGVNIQVAHDSNPGLIFRDWERGMLRPDWNSFTVSPYPAAELSAEDIAEDERIRQENKIRQEKAEAEYRERERIKKENFLATVGDTQISLKDKEKWQMFVDNNSSDYGAGCVRYAENWARLMQVKIAEGAKLEDIAEQSSFDADTEGITGFMYGCAVAVLSEVWVYGEQLRVWHNLKTQIGNEGEKANESGGVLNPALLNIG